MGLFDNISIRDQLPGNGDPNGVQGGVLSLSALPILAATKGLYGAGTGGLEGGIKGLAQGAVEGVGVAGGGILGSALGEGLSKTLPGGTLDPNLAKLLGMGIGGLGGGLLMGRPFKTTNKIKRLSDKQKLEKLEGNEAKSKAKKEQEAPVEKEARNLGLSSIKDISEGGRGAMMEHALKLLMQARAMARPTDEDLGGYGTNRDNFESALGRIAGANAGAEDGDKLDVTSIKASPKNRALGYGLAAGIPGALLGYGTGGITGALAGGLLGAGGGGIYGASSAGHENEHNLAAAKALRDYGVLTPGALTKALPLLSDKSAAEMCGCCKKSPCECPPNCSCGCKSKSAAAKPGLWANIHAKKERGEAAAKPGDKDYPTAKNWKKVTNESEKKALDYGEITDGVFDYLKMLPHAAAVGAGLGGAKGVMTKGPEGLVPDSLDGAARSSGIYTGGVLGSAAGLALSKFLNGGPMADRDHADTFSAMLGAGAGGTLGHIVTDKLLSKKKDKKTEENNKAEKKAYGEIKPYRSRIPMAIDALPEEVRNSIMSKVTPEGLDEVENDPGYNNVLALNSLLSGGGGRPSNTYMKKKFNDPNFREALLSDIAPMAGVAADAIKAEKKASPAWQTSEGKSESGGLNDKGRASLKAQGHDIKRPQPEGGPRKDSFCARMKGMKSKLTSEETARDPDSRINKALRKWKCGSAAEKLASLLKTSKCWEGYERVPGTKPLTPGSCRPVGGKKKEDKAEKSK